MQKKSEPPLQAWFGDSQLPNEVDVPGNGNSLHSMTLYHLHKRLETFPKTIQQGDECHLIRQDSIKGDQDKKEGCSLSRFGVTLARVHK